MNQRTMTTPVRGFLTLLVVATSLAAAPISRAAGAAPIVRVVTPLGSFDIELFEDVAPVTVANFLKYISDGDFTDTFIHRSVPGFIIQGGGFVFTGPGTTRPVLEDPAIVNEFSRSNVRGTVAMAKLAGDPNSAASQWFISLADNSSTLDGQNGGFTVFGQVVNGGMAVVDAIAAVPIFNAGGVFSELPLINYTPPDQILGENLIFTEFPSSAPEPTQTAPPVLLRRTRNRRWLSYRLRLDDDGVEIQQKGSVKLTRDAAFATVSRADFDGDGEPDVLLREAAGAPRGSATDKGRAGGWILATLDGKKITSEGEVELTPDGDFEVISSSDFNGDGKADVLLRNRVDGSWLLYLLDTQTVISEISLGLSSKLADTPVDTSDFNNDGRADVLLRRGNGSWLLYTFDEAGLTLHKPKIARNRKFTVQAVADFDGDGFTDVLVRHDNGSWVLYLLDGKKVRSKGDPGMSKDTDFTLQSHADFNGDGTADALLRHADGSWFLYSLDGLEIASEGALGMSTDLGFEIVSITDFNGDGMADALLRHTDGSWVIYALDGTVPAVLATEVPEMTENTDWVPQGDG